MELFTIKNPEYYKAQSKRLSTASIPRVINCSGEDLEHLILPRGCKEGLVALLENHGIEAVFKNETYEGERLDIEFTGKLTSQQLDAVSQLMQYDHGVLSATTGFGKTVAAAALIAERKVNTLIIVDKTQLKQQWVSQLGFFLNLDKTEIGEVGGGKEKITGNVDVVTLQSLAYKARSKALSPSMGKL